MGRGGGTSSSQRISQGLVSFFCSMLRFADKPWKKQALEGGYRGVYNCTLRKNFKKQSTLRKESARHIIINKIKEHIFYVSMHFFQTQRSFRSLYYSVAFCP